jgi:hypothetical protein
MAAGDVWRGFFVTFNRLVLEQVFWRMPNTFR